MKDRLRESVCAAKNHKTNRVNCSTAILANQNGKTTASAIVLMQKVSTSFQKRTSKPNLPLTHPLVQVALLCRGSENYMQTTKVVSCSWRQLHRRSHVQGETNILRNFSQTNNYEAQKVTSIASNPGLAHRFFWQLQKKNGLGSRLRRVYTQGRGDRLRLTQALT